jgi:hypothetical protein
MIAQGSRDRVNPDSSFGGAFVRIRDSFSLSSCLHPIAVKTSSSIAAFRASVRLVSIDRPETKVRGFGCFAFVDSTSHCSS